MIRTAARSAAFLSISQIAIEASALGRNMILANLLGPENLGIAASIALGLRILEMVSDVAVDRFLLQAPDGDRPEVVNVGHGLCIARGLLVGVAFAALAYPIAAALDSADSALAISALGLVPAVRGFLHLDHKRLMRHMRHRSAAAVELVAALGATAVAWPIAALVGNFEAIIWISLVQAICLVLASHFLAERSYAISYRRPILRRFLVFGWPLVVGGLCVFGALQGDRLIIAVNCSMAELGRFTVAAQLALVPCFMGVRVVSFLGLPMLSGVTGDRAEFENRYGLVLIACATAAAGLIAAFVFLADIVIRTFYGSDFLIAPSVTALLALSVALRLLRAAPTVARLAEGDSRSSMSVDLWRLVGLGIAGLAGGLTGELTWIVAGACAGELLALLIAARHVEARVGISAHSVVLPALALFATAGLSWTGITGLIEDWLLLPLGGVVALVLVGWLVSAHRNNGDIRAIASAPGLPVRR